MEGNKEEAIRCLSIAQRHRSSSNLTSALKFARKSVSLYSTAEGEAMVIVIEREIESGGSASTPPPTTHSSQENGTSQTGQGSSAKASGVEEHVTSAHSRPGHGKSAPPAGGSAAAGTADKGKKRDYTPKQMEVVKRVKACKHHEYYEILAIEKTCTENDVKKAYRKLALALHPDKNGAPGADEAFKMVSKAFQVLSDADLRAAFDSNPSYDPTQRNPGMASRGGGGMHPGFGGGGMYQSDINPEDLFNMFFGGGGMGGGGSPFGQANVFTFGGPGGFQAQYGRPRRPTTARQGDTPASPLVALLPIIILFLFALISILPSIFSATQQPDPSYAFEPTQRLETGRKTFNWEVPYFVNSKEWEGSEIWKSVPEARRGEKTAAMFSQKLRGFEKGVEGVYVRKLQNECQHFNDVRQQRISDASGFFGIGADYDKIAELRAQKSAACEQLRAWRINQYSGQW